MDTRRSPGDSAVQLFSGMVFCGEVRRKHGAQNRSLRQQKYVYYVCAAHKQDKSCSLPPDARTRRLNNWFWTQ